jgi:hypothetical protein
LIGTKMPNDASMGNRGGWSIIDPGRRATARAE